MPEGTYKKRTTKHNDRPVYQYDGPGPEWCIFQGKLGEGGGHWKIDMCSFLPEFGGRGDWSRGIAWTDVVSPCPGVIGQKWRYYSWGSGGRIFYNSLGSLTTITGSGSGPINTNIRVTCLGGDTNCTTLYVQKTNVHLVYLIFICNG